MVRIVLFAFALRRNVKQMMLIFNLHSLRCYPVCGNDISVWCHKYVGWINHVCLGYVYLVCFTLVTSVYILSILNKLNVKLSSLFLLLVLCSIKSYFSLCVVVRLCCMYFLFGFGEWKGEIFDCVGYIIIASVENHYYVLLFGPMSSVKDSLRSGPSLRAKIFVPSIKLDSKAKCKKCSWW